MLRETPRNQVAVTAPNTHAPHAFVKEPPVIPDYAVAKADVVGGIYAYPIWTRLGWQEVKRRYRRTIFGPFWATLSLGIFIGAISFVWAPLFKANLQTYLPFVTAGMISWSYVSAVVTEGSTTFTGGESLIKQLNFPYSAFVFIVVWRNMIVLFHHFVILIFVYAAFPAMLNFNILLLPLGLAIVALNGVWIATLLGMISARFRDIPPLVGNLLQVMLFITPIFWEPGQLGHTGEYFVKLNYLYHLVDIMRSPLLGHTPLLLSYIVTIVGGMLGCVGTFLIYARFRRRIAFWL
jgi:ABC-type polysaccharide/polyol phosphate export permease